MAEFEVRISDLPGGNPLSGIELVPMVQDGVTVTRSVSDIVLDGGLQEHIDAPDPHPQYAFRVLNNLYATRDPLPTDDINDGYTPTSRWVNTNTGEFFICVTNNAGSASWQQMTLTVDELGSAAMADVGTAATELPTNQTTDNKYLQKTDNLASVSNAQTSFDNIKQDATTSYKGVVEVATNAEALVGASGKFPDAANVRAAFEQYGLGITNSDVSIPEGDLDATRTNGIFRFTSATPGTKPFSDIGQVINTFQGAGFGSQLAVRTNTPTDVYVRTLISNIWTGWVKLYHTGNTGAGSGLDSDLLDGQEGAFYQNASNLNAGTISDARLPATISSDITGNAATATNADQLDGQHGAYYLDWANTTNKPDPLITLNGDVSGSGTMTNLGNVTIAVHVLDDSHNHTISNIDNLQGELDSKVDKITGKGLSTEDYTTAEKNKLAGIEAGAEVNTVDSVNGKTNTVILVTDDISEDASPTNLWYTNARARDAIGVSGDLSYNPTTGVISFNETYSTATELLNAIKTVDGSGSGLDADLLDGLQASQFLRSDTSDTMNGVLTVNNTIKASVNASQWALQGESNGVNYSGLWFSGDNGQILLRDSTGAIKTTLSSAGTSTINSNLTVTNDIIAGGGIVASGDTNTYHQFNAADTWRVVTGGGQRMAVTNNGVVVDQNLTVNGSINAYGNFINFITGTDARIEVTDSNPTVPGYGAGSEFIFWGDGVSGYAQLKAALLEVNNVSTYRTTYDNPTRSEGCRVEYNETSKSLEYNFF